MLYCIPTDGNRGKEDVVSEHFGSASFFTLYNSETDAIEVLENRNTHHAHGTCHPMTQLSKYHISSIVCSGIGRRAIEALQAENIKVFLAPDNRVSAIIEAVKGAGLQEVDPLTACRGHGQHQSQGSSQGMRVRNRNGFGGGGRNR